MNLRLKTLSAENAPFVSAQDRPSELFGVTRRVYTGEETLCDC